MEKLNIQEQKMINAGGSTFRCAATTAAGAATGAMGGAALGPIGIYGGLVVGGIGSGVNADACKK
ncbi:hypothetical protein [Staphylococcus shinii]|uniref:hypothetical protein n=1 Tax=Staphylococcus shinii TaxID=2912228 RepID=UPI003F6031BA